MSLGQDLAPHLPFLRRYARALTGSQRSGDGFVRATLEAIVADPSSFPRDVDPRLGLYALFQRIWKATEFEVETISNTASGETRDSNEEIAQGRLSALTPLSRQALLLAAMEGFTEDDTAYLLGVSPTDAGRLVAEAVAELEMQTRSDVLIIEDEPIIAMDIETIVRDLGHNVIGVAVTRAEAVQRALENRPGLILADIQLYDDSSGIDAVKDILEVYQVPVIFVTAFPERLLTGERPEPTYLITKPFRRSTFKAAINQALFFGAAPAKPDPPPIPEGFAAAAVDPIPRAMVRPQPSPVNAKVVASQLRYADSTPAAAGSSDSIVNSVRSIHLATAKRLVGNLAGANVGPGFNARFDAIYRLLKRRLTQERALQLVIHARGLERMMGAISERLDDVTVADVAVFVADLIDLLNQLPAYRLFAEEARLAGLTGEAVQIASTVVDELERQPDALVDRALKDAMRSVSAAAAEQGDALTNFAVVRTVSNVFRAVGRFFNERLGKLKQKATDTFDETAGKALGNTLAYLLVGTPIGAALVGLSALFPSEFGFVAQLIRAAKALF
jgi:CheY-like chemotaxis protein/DNA-directed RNA polymerase specialized sigma24 family protein